MTLNDTQTPQLFLTRKDALGWVTISNLKRRNAMTVAMWQALPDIIGEADGDERIRVVVLRGAGETAFCAGADISEFEEQRTGASAERYNKLNHNAFLALESCKKPTIAMIHGFCLGGGLGLALSCDLRIASEDAQFSIPAAKLGIAYHPRWVRQILKAISPTRAKEMLFTGDRYDAKWAASVGLINRLCQKDALLQQTEDLATAISENAPLSLRATKNVFETSSKASCESSIERLEKMVAACFESEDYKEGWEAFLEKRRPKFKGR